MIADTLASRGSSGPGDLTEAVSLGCVSCCFGSRYAVRDMTLALARGEFFSLIGASGCGKSTTLRMIAGLQRPTTGQVFVAGKDVTALPAHRREVNTVFQHYALFPHLNVFENVAFGLRERHTAKPELARRVAEMLELVGLGDRGAADVRQLSGGQQQRVALGRALILEPAVLLLDEPLGALDLKLRRQMQLVLKDVQRRVRITFLYVTHDQEEAFAMSDRVGVMREGMLDQVGTPEEIYRRPKTLFVADFVGASNRLPGTVAAARGDTYDVELHVDGRVVPVQGSAGLAAGQEVAVIVRPEALVLNSGSGTELIGRLLDVSFLGSQTIYTVDVEGCGELTAAESRPSRTSRAHGEQVTLGFDPQDAWAVPA